MLDDRIHQTVTEVLPSRRFVYEQLLQYDGRPQVERVRNHVDHRIADERAIELGNHKRGTRCGEKPDAAVRSHAR